MDFDFFIELILVPEELRQKLALAGPGRGASNGRPHAYLPHYRVRGEKLSFSKELRLK